MIVYPDYDKKDQLFKLWDAMGVDYKHTRYLGDKFETMQDYYLYVADYYDVKPLSTQGLISHIINEANEYLSNPDNIPCGGDAIVRMTDIDHWRENFFYSPSTMKLWYDAMGTKPTASFEYDLVNPDGFECMEIPGFPEEDMRYEFIRIFGDVDFDNMTKEQEDKYKDLCFSEGCLHFTIRDVLSKIAKKYGIRTNVNVDKIS
jgi:hypothetical protein